MYVPPAGWIVPYPAAVRVGLVFQAHRLCISLNSRLESNKEEEEGGQTHVCAARRVVCSLPYPPLEGGFRVRHNPVGSEKTILVGKD